MTKTMARLEFEMPSSCEDCPLDYYRDGWEAEICMCYVTRQSTKEYNFDRPDWCPLEEVQDD